MLLIFSKILSFMMMIFVTCGKYTRNRQTNKTLLFAFQMDKNSLFGNANDISATHGIVVTYKALKFGSNVNNHVLVSQNENSVT